MREPKTVVEEVFRQESGRIIATLINDLQTHDQTFGIATLCIGGGQGLATIIERMS